MGSFLHRLLILLPLAVAACGPADPPVESADALLQDTAAAHRDDAPAASPVATTPPARPVLEQVLAYGELGNRNLEGFLAMPADAAEPLPGILVIHEWWGLNENIRAATRRLAAEGYVALAVDLYDGATAATPQEAQDLMAAAMADPERTLANLQQAYEYLDRYAFSPRVGVLGWCFGGGWSLQAALKLPEGLDAAVMYYGQVVTDRDELRALQVPLLGLFGALDEAIPVRDVQVFRNRLNELEKEAEVYIYTDAEHAFANPSGGNYSAVAAEDAWRRTIDFLGARLQARE
jgi:carboxymethylenebutenolidase